MSYALSNDEYYELHTVNEQLDLLSNMTMAGGTLQTSLESLGSMFLALQKPLTRVLRALDERDGLRHALDNEMTPALWAHAIRIAGGDSLHTPNGCEVQITQRLANAAKIDEAMKMPFDAWLSVLGKDDPVNVGEGVVSSAG